MQISNLPKLLPVPFANSGSKQDIPVASQIGVSGGRASYTDGFPPLTRTPIAAGGIPPFGTDFNGVLNDITSAIRWAQAGGGYIFDTDFSSTVNGYPVGAKLLSSTGDGYWLNTVDGNTNNPETSSASPLTGWVPVESYGITSVTGLGGSSVTLSTIQASRDRIVLTGTLTANINLVFPAWRKKWTIVNNCSGSFVVTVKTSIGTGVAIPAGLVAEVICDGTNINQDINIYGISGRLVNVQVFESSGTYTPTAGTKKIKITLTGGGASGGRSSTSSNYARSGGAAGTRIAFIDAPSGPTSVVIGSGGARESVIGGNGNSGGNSSFGSLMTAIGGTNSNGQGGSSSGAGFGISGGNGNQGAAASNQTFGGGSYWGGGGSGVGVANTQDGASFGSGGAGVSSSEAVSGAGKSGVCVIEEYS